MIFHKKIRKIDKNIQFKYSGQNKKNYNTIEKMYSYWFIWKLFYNSKYQYSLVLTNLYWFLFNNIPWDMQSKIHFSWILSSICGVSPITTFAIDLVLVQWPPQAFTNRFKSLAGDLQVSDMYIFPALSNIWNFDTEPNVEWRCTWNSLKIKICVYK